MKSVDDQAETQKVTLAGPGLTIEVERTGKRWQMIGLEQAGEAYLFADRKGVKPGPGPVGNPFAISIAEGPLAGWYDLASFGLIDFETTERRLTVEMMHDHLPLRVILEIEVEGHTAVFRGQVAWEGDDAVDLEIYYPLFSRVFCGAPATDRVIMPRLSGAVLPKVSQSNCVETYIGSLSSPTWLVDGGSRGLAFLDDNRTDFAADPGACVRHAFVTGNNRQWFISAPPGARTEGGTQGPFIGARSSRVLQGQRPSPFANQVYPDHHRPGKMGSYSTGDKLIDYVDLGPVKVHSYRGSWEVGTSWLKNQRRTVVTRQTPAWFAQSPFLAEDMGDSLVADGRTYYDYVGLLDQAAKQGATLFHLPGYHEPERLGSTMQWMNRGDYVYPSERMGGLEAMRAGIRAVHQRGGRVLYYVEGWIVWKASRIGLRHGADWATYDRDGNVLENYRDFWHMAPTNPEWRAWLAQTCADLVRATGIDGIFLDSLCATSNHRLYPATHAGHPDTWNWGVRQTLKALREALDAVNPEAVLIVEGYADLAAEYVDGFLCHSHQWNAYQFSAALMHQMHPEIAVFESWGLPETSQTMEGMLVWNAVHGLRIYSHAPSRERIAPLAQAIRDYYDMYPEVFAQRLVGEGLKVEGGYAQWTVDQPRLLTVGNVTDQPSNVDIHGLVGGTMLFDRRTGDRIAVLGDTLTLAMPAYGFRVFEIRD